MSFAGLNDEIETINGYNKLNFNLEPNTSIIIEPSTLNHMNGKLILEPTIGKTGFLSAFKRSITGESLINSQIANKTNENLKLSLSPPLLGTINKIEIQPGQIWRFAPSSFIACTNNIIISGNLNIFSNFKMAFTGQNVIYTEISTHDDKPGIVWISSYGAIEKHEIQMGKHSDKLVINDGVFLGMLSEDKNKKINYWNKFIHIGSANGFFKGLLTNTALLMNIEDKNHEASDDVKCILYTQSLNIRNFNNYIQSISINSSNNNMTSSILSDIVFNGGNSNISKLQKYEHKLNSIKNSI
jgi:uncharacterized protein (AIM24 family)